MPSTPQPSVHQPSTRSLRASLVTSQDRNVGLAAVPSRAEPIRKGRSDVMTIADGSTRPRSLMTTLHWRLNVTRLTKAPGGVASMKRTMALPPLCLRARLVAATAAAVLALSQLASAQPDSRITEGAWHLQSGRLLPGPQRSSGHRHGRFVFLSRRLQRAQGKDTRIRDRIRGRAESPHRLCHLSDRQRFGAAFDTHVDRRQRQCQYRSC